MKYYNPKTIKPSPDEFHRFTKDKLSETARQSISCKATANLFGTVQKLYSSLDHLTSERLSVFVDSQTYLSQQQEHDLIALTAIYSAQQNTQLVREIIEQDSATTDSEKTLLLAAVELFVSTAASACAALGNPRWVEGDMTTASV